MQILIYGSPFILAAFIIVISLLMEKVFPSTMQKTNKGKLKDSYTVSVTAVAGKGSEAHLDCVFTKRKSGKYRYRFGVFEWIIFIVVVLPTVALGIWIINDYWEMIIKSPLEMTSYAVVIVLDLLLLIVLLCNPIMRAIMYFKRFEKMGEQI